MPALTGNLKSLCNETNLQNTAAFTFRNLNPNHFLMKKSAPYIIIAILLGIIFLMQQCEGKSEPEKLIVDIPEINGSFEAEKPKHTDQEIKTVIEYEDLEIEVPNPVNQNLLKKYQVLEDSLTKKEAEYQRLLMFVDAIQIREFSQTFEDSLVKIDVFGKVQGEIKEMQSNYTIKERQIEVEQEEVVFRLLAGLEFGQNLMFNDFRYKANLGFQNRKGNIFRAGYERINDNDYIFIGYDFSVSEITK